MSNDVFDVFLLRGKEEENGGLTFDPEKIAWMLG